jgi:hypothetical protein
LLAPGGVLVLDAFVRRDVAAFDDFRLDYRRPHGDGTLERHKRIATAGGINTIERRYRLRDAGDRLVDEFTTRESIRPYAAATLRAAAEAAGLRLQREVLDYGACQDPASARRSICATRGVSSPRPRASTSSCCNIGNERSTPAASMPAASSASKMRPVPHPSSSAGPPCRRQASR